MDIEQIVREHIDKTVHLSLATSKDNKPWVCEVHFAYDNDLNLYFRSLTSRRHSREVAENPNVAGNIVRQHELDETPVGVYFEGTCEKLDEDETKDIAFECLEKRLNIGEEALTEAQRPDGHQFYKTTVTNWYVFGKFDENGGQKHKLEWNKA